MAGSALRAGLNLGSGGALRMSPSRSTESLRLMEILPDLRQPQHGLADASRQHIESHQFADRQVAGDHQPGPEIEGPAIMTLLTNCTLLLAVLPSCRTRKLAAT